MRTSPLPSSSPAATTADRWRRVASKSVHPSATDGGEPPVAAIAEGLAAVALPWELRVDHDPTERQFELLLTTEVYDAWLIHWPPGSGLGAHDHGGSAGAFAVVSGVLDEDELIDGGTSHRRIGPGGATSFGGGTIHIVTNRGDVGATSVHVYAPPLRSMGFYAADDAGKLARERVTEVATPSWSPR